jgi:L-fuculose-phosphate aldolase
VPRVVAFEHGGNWWEQVVAEAQLIDAGAQAGQELEQLKETFVTACRILANEGVSEAAFNVSCRLAGGMMMANPITSPTLVTASNLAIYPIAEGSDSFKAHPAIYEARPDVNAIVHVHAPYAIAFSTLGEEFRPVHHYGAPFHGHMTTFRSPGQTKSKDRARELARQLGPNRVILQQGHGSIAVGNDLKEAVLLTLYLEEACKILCIARQMGTPQYLSREESEKITGQILKPRSQNKAWQHYVDKLRFARRSQSLTRQIG